MSKIQIKVKGIYCVKIYEYFICILYYLEIDLNWGQIIDDSKYSYLNCYVELQD